MRALLFLLSLLTTQTLWALPETCMGRPDPLCLLEAAEAERLRLDNVPPEYAEMRAALLNGLAEDAAEAGDLERAFALLLRVSGIKAEDHNRVLEQLALEAVERGELELFSDISWELSSDESRIAVLKGALRQLTGRHAPDDIAPEALAAFYGRAEHQLRRHLSGEPLNEWLKRLMRGYGQIGESADAERLSSELQAGGDEETGHLEQGDFTAMMAAQVWNERPQKRAKEQLDALRRWEERWPGYNAASLALGNAGAGGLSAVYIDLGLRIHEARRLAETDPLSARQRMESIVANLRGLPDAPERDRWLYSLVDMLMGMDKGNWETAARWSAAINDRAIRLKASAEVMEAMLKLGAGASLPMISAYFDDPIIPLLVEYEQGEHLRRGERGAESVEHYRRAMRMGMALEEDVAIDGRSLKLMLVMEVMGRARKVNDPQLAREAGHWLERNIAVNDAEPVMMTLNLAEEYLRIGDEGDAERLLLGLKGQLHSLTEREQRKVVDQFFKRALDDRDWAEAESLIHQLGDEERRLYLSFQLAERQFELGDNLDRGRAVERLLTLANAQERYRNQTRRMIQEKGDAEALERLRDSGWLDEKQRESLTEVLLEVYLKAGELKPARRVLARLGDDEAVHRLIAPFYRMAGSGSAFADLAWAEIRERGRVDDAVLMGMLMEGFDRTPVLSERYGEAFKAMLASAPAGLRLRLRAIPLRRGPGAEPGTGQGLDEWNAAWRQLLREGESLAMAERLLLWLAVAQAQLLAPS